LHLPCEVGIDPNEVFMEIDINELKECQKRRKYFVLAEGSVLGLITFGISWWLVPTFINVLAMSPDQLRLLGSITIAVAVLVIVVIYRFLSHTALGRSLLAHDQACDRCSKDRLALKEKDDILVDNHKKAQTILTTVSSLTELMRVHLGKSGDITETAVLGIMKRLTEVEAEATGLLNVLDEGKSQAANLCKDADKLIEESQGHVEEMNNYKIHREQQIPEDRDAIESVVRGVEDLKPLTELIREVAAQTNLLALNANIEAVRAGQAGRGFAVVANEVRKLAKQVHNAAERIEDGIIHVTKTVNEKLLAIVAANRVETEAVWLSELSRSMTLLSMNFQSAVWVLDGLSLNSYKAVSSIRTAVLDVLQHTQFQDITRQQINLVQDVLALSGQHLEDMGERLGSDVITPLEIEPFDAVIDNFRSNAAMQTETPVQQTQVENSSHDSNSRPAIELF